MQAKRKKNWGDDNHQIPSTKIQIISKFQAPKMGVTNCLGHWSLVIGYYLAFVIWLLEFCGRIDGSDS
jgi:hypothetical protein